MKNARQALTPILTFILALLAGGVAHAQVIVYTDTSNTGYGTDAMPSGTNTGSFNTADGYSALYSNTTGSANTANGYRALNDNTTGGDNTANGCNALASNTGSDNTANGSGALAGSYGNSTGSDNTATGVDALFTNTTGSNNSANGSGALDHNTTGSYNTADGDGALFYNTPGFNNAANGYQALYHNTTGANNTANGYSALFYNTTGQGNIALGHLAGLNVTAGSNNIDIGSRGSSGTVPTIYLGTQGTQTKTFIAGIQGTPLTGAEVVVTASGQLGTLASSARYKRDIHDMGVASNALMALRPVSFKYKPEIDPTGTTQFGLIAEEVEKVSPDLVVHDANHQVYTVRYEAVNAMLLNEFQKQHETIAEQEKHAEDQDKTIADQQKLLQSLAARLDQVEQAQGVSR
jgi:hypothetical protein